MPYRRNWIAGVLLIGMLIGCGQATPLNIPPTNTSISPAHATAAVVLTAVAEGGEGRVEPATAAQPPGATATPEPATGAPPDAVASVATNVTAAEQTVRSYFAAFGERRAADAWALLAPVMQANTTFEMFETTTLAVQSLSVTRIDSVIAADERLIYGVTVEAAPVPGLPTRWNPGPNQLYVVVIATPDGWRIAAITDAPPLY
jgi:predicted small lipoprotein YifL